MNRLWRSGRVARVSLAMLLGISMLGATGSCSSQPKVTIDTLQPFAEPPLRFESLGRNHVAVFTAPTSGWTIRHDMTRRVFRVYEVFVTLRQPAPGTPTAQVLSEHAVDTGVESIHNAAVYARIITGRDAAGETPYRLAGEVTPNPPSR